MSDLGGKTNVYLTDCVMRKDLVNWVTNTVTMQGYVYEYILWQCSLSSRFATLG